MSNCIAETLEIKDENIILENRVERFSNGYITAKCYFGTLTYTPNHCENCGFPNENHRIVKNGKRQILIKVPKVSEVPTYISLKKQRFLCRQCHSTFVAQSEIVDKHCVISNNTKK